MKLSAKLRNAPKAFISAVVAAALLLTPALASPAAAAPRIDPDARAELVITKLQQPEQFGTPANGMPLGADVIGDLTPIPGVTFEIRQVPGIDLTTNEGQRQTAALTVAEAISMVEDVPAAASGVTDDDGVIHLTDLPIGLYLVEETVTPAGVVASAPFLVALPLTNPAGTDWMFTVYVYPKNDHVDVTIDVYDETAVVCGDTVTWTTHNVIPKLQTIDHYLTRNLLAENVKLLGLDGIEVRISGDGSPALTPGDDYILTEIVPGADGREGFDVEFTEAGRAKLVEARDGNPTAQVVVTYPSNVTSAGEHVNEVQLFVNNALPVHDTTVTKWGPLKIYVHERGKPENQIPGATFKLYLTAEDAAAGTNPIIVHGDEVFTTDEDGYIVIGCLRYSDFVNGLDREPGDPLYRPYFAKPESYPAGWEGEWDILSGIVNVPNEEDAPVLIWQVWRSEPPLEETGAQIAGAVTLGVLLIAAGALFFLRRRRKPGTAE